MITMASMVTTAASPAAATALLAAIAAAAAAAASPDYKRWNWWSENDYREERSGFLFVMGSTNHELRSGDSRQAWDVCYCDDMCDFDENWFKVGQMRFAPFQLVAHARSSFFWLTPSRSDLVGFVLA
ncbi:unnamed protein product [Prorocentrum cordatum]|uniref:Secreted protein n=1 Tax=Prorocentrum cordatum TaxID=2364126 RepID=A0ABN9Q067_9DINO|nr:unnamed protein product [Polarella glacialis]